MYQKSWNQKMSSISQMGVQDIFSSAANFTGIVFNEHLLLANIIQNAKIEVDEEGTVATAATGNYQ